MMRQYELVERVHKYKPDVNEALLNKAYVYAMQKHGKQTRASGDPYISHPLEVAAILTDMHLDESTIAVALLHDTIEDTTATRDEIDELFGEDIGALVEGLTKIKKLDLVTKRAKQAENLRKLLLAVSDDVRVLLVKLADRLHNMRTLDHVAADKRVRIAEETMDIYAPLAGRMGMQDMREELEQLSFQHLNREAFETVSARLEELTKKNKGIIKKIETELQELFVEKGLEAKVSGRQKKPYSIFRKMQSKSLSFEQLSDLYGFRIIVNDLDDCYRALGIVHTRWSVVPGRFKDYISTPKQNDYRSIHTTIIGPSRQRVELQIRTQRMHEIAEYGVAAHSLYKDKIGDASLPEDSRAYSWLRHTIEQLSTGDNPEEFLEHTKLELFHDQVFCFTPKGRLIALPRGATPIDFAYSIHTRIGHSCVGAKVDGLRVPLWTRLKNGQSVDIITAEGQTPQATWIDIATTGRAKAAIRRSLREVDRDRYVKLGRELARVAFEQYGKKATDRALATAAKALSLKSGEEVLARIGSAELSAREVVRELYPELSHSSDETVIDDTRAVIGLPPGARTQRAQCCQAVPGERIIGITYPGKGPLVHSIDCGALAAFDDQPDRWIDLHWTEGRHAAVHNVTLDVTVSNENGVLGRICTLIGEQNANISDLHFVDRKPDFFRLLIDVDVRDAEHLHAVMIAVEAEADVATMDRFRDLERRP